MTAKPESRFVRVNALELHLLDWAGQGPAVILLHGLASNAHIWDAVAPYLVEGARVVALDQRGHGRTSLPADPSTGGKGIRLDRKTLVVTPQAEIAPPLKGFEDITFAMRNTGAFALTYKTSEHSVEELLDRVRAAGVAIKDLSIEEPDLEDVFVELTA